MSTTTTPHEPEHKPDGLDFELPPPAQVTRSRVVGIFGGIAVVLGLAFVARWLPKHHEQAALAEDARTFETGTLRVQVVAPKVISSDRALTLPGSVQPLEEAVLYPRANGYVRKWYVDLGDHVKEGQTLADIDTPDLDQQLAQSRAQLTQAEAAIVQAKANAHFSKGNYERYKQLVPAGLASQQDLEKQQAQAEVDQAGIGVAEANAGSMRANMQMLMQLKSFATVIAPFNGRITLRSIERGTLVSSGTATPLFRIQATDPVRVYIQVPQDVAPNLKVDTEATVAIREYPGRIFKGKVARSSGSLDAATRTMMTEIRVPNSDEAILAGMYANVSITLPTPHRVLSIPASALSNDAQGRPRRHGRCDQPRAPRPRRDRARRRLDDRGLERHHPRGPRRSPLEHRADGRSPGRRHPLALDGEPRSHPPARFPKPLRGRRTRPPR